MAYVPFSTKVLVLLTILVVVFSIVWSSPPPQYPQVRRSGQSLSSNLHFSNGRSADQARFLFGNFMLPNFTSWGNLFNLNGSVISFIPLGQLLFAG